jgi:cytochrome c556
MRQSLRATLLKDTAMTFVPAFRSCRFIVAAAALAGLLVAGDGQTRQPGNKAAKAQAKIQEMADLKTAYILMAMGDHDYDGHRVKAMGQVEEAIKKLDHTVMKDGTNGQKVVALDEEIGTARAAFIAKHQGKVHEGQWASDLQLKEAREVLMKVKESLPQAKHPKPHEHIQNAIKQVDIALSKR